jgi:hypothetical protein
MQKPEAKETKEHISVCIATRRRKELLKKLLSALTAQETDGKFSYSIIVVENDDTGKIFFLGGRSTRGLEGAN